MLSISAFLGAVLTFSSLLTTTAATELRLEPRQATCTESTTVTGQNSITTFTIIYTASPRTVTRTVGRVTTLLPRNFKPPAYNVTTPAVSSTQTTYKPPTTTPAITSGSATNNSCSTTTVTLPGSNIVTTKIETYTPLETTTVVGDTTPIRPGPNVPGPETNSQVAFTTVQPTVPGPLPSPPPGTPDLPPIPNPPNVPSIPQQPDTPSGPPGNPVTPSVPEVSNVPGTPQQPDVPSGPPPGSPVLPSVPDTLNTPQPGTLNVPQPGTLNAPQPGTPNIPQPGASQSPLIPGAPAQSANTA